MFKASVEGSWEDIVDSAKLLNLSKSLELRSVYKLPVEFFELNLVLHTILDISVASYLLPIFVV